MLILTGKPVSDGIGIGPLALFRRAKVSTEVRPVADREAELARFREARDTAAGPVYQGAGNHGRRKRSHL